MRATVCAECGYFGPVVETHALYAVLQEDVEHAQELLADSTPNEQASLHVALDELMHIAMAVGSG